MKVKRLLGVLLTVCIVISMFAVSGIVTTAEEELPVIEIIDAQDAIVGEMPVNGLATVPEDAEYTVDIVWWVYTYDGDYASRSSFSGPFEKGKIYCREWNITVTDEWEGWDYADDYGDVPIQLVANGEVIDEDCIFADGTRTYDRDDFNLTELLDSAEIIGVKEAEVGATATTSGIKVPDGAKYTASAEWYIYDPENGQTEFSGTFTKGESYDLEITLTAADGYSFAEDSVIKINGEEIATESSYVSFNKLYISLTYDLREEINAVEITNTEKAEVGKTASVSGVSIPENADYSLVAQWIEGDPDMSDPDIFEDEFADGKAYALILVLMTNDGYRFADDVDIKMNDSALPESAYIGIGGDEIIVFADGIIFGQEKIDKIEITADPTPGKTPEEITVSVPDNALYSIEEVVWYNAETWETVEGKFEEGKSYGVSVSLTPDDGYYFAIFAETVINGKSSDAYEGFISSTGFKDGYIEFEIKSTTVSDNNGGQSSDNGASSSRPTSPLTGESGAEQLIIALALLSLAGMVIVLSVKKLSARKF